MPDCSVRRMAFSVTLSESTRRSASSFFRNSRASGTRTLRGCFFLGKNLEKASCRELCISSMPEAEKTSTIGVPPAEADTASSTRRSSRSPPAQHLPEPLPGGLALIRFFPSGIIVVAQGNHSGLRLWAHRIAGRHPGRKQEIEQTFFGLGRGPILHTFLLFPGYHGHRQLGEVTDH